MSDMIKYVIKRGKLFESGPGYCNNVENASFYCNPPTKCRGEKVFKVTFKVDKIEEDKSFVGCNNRQDKVIGGGLTLTEKKILCRQNCTRKLKWNEAKRKECRQLTACKEELREQK